MGSPLCLFRTVRKPVWLCPTSLSAARNGVVERHELGPAEEEAVVGEETAVPEVYVDLLVEGGEFGDADVSGVGIDEGQVVADPRVEVAAGEEEVAVSPVGGMEGGGEGTGGKGETDTHVAGGVGAESGVDAHVQGFEGTGVGPDPGPEVGAAVAVDVDRVDPAHHAAPDLLYLEGGVGLTQRTGEHLSVCEVGQSHPRAPPRDDLEVETAGVLVELPDQGIDPGGIEARPRKTVDRIHDPDVGRVASEGAADLVGVTAQVVDAHVP